jgi:hypothetical protein
VYVAVDEGDPAAAGAKGFDVGKLVAGLVVGAVVGGVAGLEKEGAGDLHHIATNKNWTGTLRGGPWSPRFDKLYKKAGMTLEDSANKVRVPGHRGPHPQAYHEAVESRVRTATEGLSGVVRTEALRAELGRIRAEILTEGSVMNMWVTGR